MSMKELFMVTLKLVKLFKKLVYSPIKTIPLELLPSSITQPPQTSLNLEVYTVTISSFLEMVLMNQQLMDIPVQ